VTLTASRRLPGIRFEAQPPVPDDVLPRMDIAGFVGFAASGPVGLPVAVEDPSEFARVFGADAPLAWDDARGEPVQAYLAPAVRAFFRNGGRRCWVVRVAGAHAATDRFELEAVAGLRIDPSGTGPPAFEPALVEAASPGSWADGLSLRTALAASALRFEDANLAASRLTAVVGRGDEVVAGDLIRLRFADSPWTLLVVAAAIGPAPLPSPPPIDGSRRLQVGWSRHVWLGPGALAAGIAGTASYLGLDGGDVAVSATTAARLDGDADGVVRLVLGDAATRPPRGGATMRGTFGGRTLLIEVVAVEASKTGAVVVGMATAIELDAPVPAPVPAPEGVAERLQLELRVEGPGRAPAVLTGLGFAPAHPRFVGALPGDVARYALTEGPDGLAANPGADAAQAFPLAAPERPPACYVPFATTLRSGRSLAALRPAGDARTRDGLEHFDARLFVDGDLASTSTARLIETADWLRDQSPLARPLQGIHALLAIDEITIVAVPDAVHRHWLYAGAATATAPQAPAAQPALDWSRFRDCGDRVPAAPALTLTGDAESGAFTLGWTATDAGGAIYELQESSEPDFTPAETVHRGPGRTLELHDRPRGFVLYYQVRAVVATKVSDWSNRLLVHTAPAARWLLDAAAVYDPAPLVELQLALLRMCAARGDMLAVLALPEHYREQAAVAHVSALDVASHGPDAGAYGRDPILGYGALYHPWLHVSEPEGPVALRLLAPDGAAAGVIVARAADRGAWVAPANERLRDVVALEPAVTASARLRLQDAQVNLVRQEPEGFLWLSADTLSGDDDVRSIGVRRLLQTVRRLAVRHGNAMAFEPNDDVARRAVRRSFEALLGRMFELGAFAGRTPGEGFRVDTPVARGDLDQGRIVVELQVAPARPLSFLTVRLVRSGTGTLQVEAR
jgi:hypothetical protein